MNSTPKAFDPKSLRKTVLDMAYAGSTVHIGCAFSIIELLAVLYRNHLRYPNNDPLVSGRDFVLSKGHGSWLSTHAWGELGWLKKEFLFRLFFEGRI